MVVKVAELVLAEPVSDLFVGVLNRVGTVAHVSTNVKGEVTSDGTWGRLDWLGGTEEGSTGSDGVEAFPDHADDWTTHDVLNEVVEESLALEVTVMLLDVLLGWSHHFKCDEFEALSLKSEKDFSDESSLDAVWFDHDVSSFGLRRGFHCVSWVVKKI